MKRISVWGTSLKKVGDEAQNIAFVRIIKKRFPNVKITLFSQFGELVTRLVAKEGMEIETIRTAHLFLVARALYRSDLFVFEGGPFYEEPWQAMRCATLFMLAKLLNVPMIMYGATAFHFRTGWGSFFYRIFFNHMHAISVRERTAVEIIKALGVKKPVDLFADPRYVLEPPPGADIQLILRSEGLNPSEPYFVMTTRYLHQGVPRWVKRSHDYNDELVSRSNEAIGKVAAYLEDKGQIIMLPMHPSYEEDLEMTKMIQRSMRNPSRLRLLSRRYTALETIGLIDQAQLLVASRLGSAVFATITGTPLVSIAYEPRMFDHMQRIGLDQYVYDWKELDHETLIKAIREVWSGRDRIRKEMKEKAAVLREMAWKNADLLKKYI